MVNEAITAGATQIFGVGDLHTPEQGYFFPPTVLTDVDHESDIWNEEVFGPVLIIETFTSIDEAIDLANRSDYGLALSLWSQDHYTISRVTREANVGTVWVNTYRAVSFTSPFGGYKRSGIGRESGLEAIKQYMQVKSVWIAQQTSPANPFIMR